jgi:dCTP deaminase
VIKNDRQLIDLINRGMIRHATCTKRKTTTKATTEAQADGSYVVNTPALSYGVSSYGYDLRLSPKDFRLFKRLSLWQRLMGWLRGKPAIIDPKNFNPEFLEPAQLHSDSKGDFFILPGHSCALGVAMEWFHIPENCSVICQGKSTYARAGVIVFPTPFEPGWKGYPTLEFANLGPQPVKIYANEGVLQAVYFEGEPCENPYGQGKYQGQKERVTLAKV